VATKGVTVDVATDEQPAMVVPPKVKVTAPATLVVAAMGGVDPGNVPLAPLSTTVGVVVAAEADPTPKAMTLPRANDPMASTDMILFILILLLLGNDYFLTVTIVLTVTTPERVALYESFSDDPAVVPWIENDPLKLKVPDAPLNFPVPLKIFATPVTVTGDGAALLTAQAWVLDDETTLNFKPLAPVSVPEPAKGSQVLAADPPPDPFMVLVPKVPVP
jgi:hypothetical protein